MPPEPPIDQPDTETPVDHLTMAQIMLRDAEHELSQADIGKEQRRFLTIQLGAIEDMIEALR